MKLDNTGDGGDYEKPAAKTYPARLIGLYDIGMQKGFNEGDPAKNQVIMTWELVGKDKQSDGKNFQISEFLTVSLHKKGTLPKRLLALGAPVKSKSEDWYDIDSNYSLTNLLGEPAMVEVVHTEKGRAKIASVMTPVEGMQIAEPTEKLGFLDLDADDYLDYFTKAPAWIQKKCQESIGWADRA
jgi:hypothetical protein